jgi:ABC-type nickel/cobalt efflux system permease component RcnA
LPRGADRLTRAFTDLVAKRRLSVAFGLVAFGIALLLGALHALAPGHGKTVMAAYIVSERGTWRQAALIGLAVTVTHTAGVVALGVLLTTSSVVAPERLYPWFGLVSGLLLAGIGITLARRAWRTRRRATPAPLATTSDERVGGRVDERVLVGAAVGGSSLPVHDHGLDSVGGHHHHDHDHDDDHSHGHDHDHSHDHDHEPHSAVEAPGAHYHGGRLHTHAPIDPSLGWKSLLAVGFAGGLVPNPSALVVLLGAIALGRTWFGLVLVTAYGVGMAVTLTGAGLLLVRARGLIDRRSWGTPTGRVMRVTRVLPLVTSTIIIGAGCLVAASALGRI